jgi:acetyl-CoA carboxylase biotin carboxylase subunit
MFRKILIANRGEIALRIIRTCKKLGVKTVAVYSDSDLESLHVTMADEAYNIGADEPAQSYLNISRIIKTARKSESEAIHPGYGFLAENPDFAKRCEEDHLIFVGPGSKILGMIANKFESKKQALVAGVRPIPGSKKEVASSEDARLEAKRLGYPVLLKPTYGGGGRGMRIVNRPSQMENAFEVATSEAMTSFGRSELYLEKYIENPRHIEVQVLAGRRGRIIHLGERECSIQRRHQKIIEETPAPRLSTKQRQIVISQALKLAKSTGYENAGTYEFVQSSEGQFYYLETNKRIQVEHLVTEMVTGIDIVEEQLKIASGDDFYLSQDDVRFNGTALNCRINAEDPEHSFTPSPGRVTTFIPPAGPGIRIDTALYDGSIIPQFYDSLIAKIAAWGQTRTEAVERMNVALEETVVEGVKTTIPLQQSIIRDKEFVNSKFGTQWLDDFLLKWRFTTKLSREEIAMVGLALNRSRIMERPAEPNRSLHKWKGSPATESLRPALFTET